MTWKKLSKNIEDQFSSPFLRVKRFHSYKKLHQFFSSFVFLFFVFVFSFNTFAVKATTIFLRINLQIIVNVVREPVKKTVKKFPQLLCFSFSSVILIKVSFKVVLISLPASRGWRININFKFCLEDVFL